MSSKVLLKRKMLSGWFDLLISFLMDMSRTWFDIDFLFDKDVVGLIWYWFLAEEDVGADLVLTFLWRRYILYWGWYEIDFNFFFLGWYLFHLSRCRRSRGWTASFTGEPGMGISREFARWVELVGFFRRCTMYQPGHHVISGHQD